MYHYIRAYNKTLPNFKFLHQADFKLQLDYFEKKYGFVKLEDWESYVKTGNYEKIKGKIVLTFDDSIKDHFNVVYQELKKRKLWGIFYIPTIPYINNKILTVHQIHLLCGIYSGKDLLEYTKSLLSDKMIKDEVIAEFKDKSYFYWTNEDGVSEFKRILNYYLNKEYLDYILGKILEKFELNINSNKFYCSEYELKEMSKNNMILGSHSRDHLVMSNLNYNDQYTQIKESMDFIETITHTNLKTYCHPFGGFPSFNNITLKILKDLNFDYAFNVEYRDINENDWEISKYHLPRYDCNEFPYGKIREKT